MESQTIDSIFEGRQETFEDLVKNVEFLAAEYGTAGQPKVNGHCGPDVPSSTQNIEDAQFVMANEEEVLADYSIDEEFPIQELEEGRSLPSSLYRALEGNETVIPKIGNFVESDVSDLSSLEDLSEPETEYENVSNNKESTSEDQNIAVQLLIDAVVNEQTVSEADGANSHSDVSENISPAQNTSLEDTKDRNVLISNQVKGDNSLPGQIFEEKRNAENLDVKITNLGISTRIKSTETQAKNEANQDKTQDAFLDLIEEFKLDENFDYDNVELTPKNRNIQFDTVCI